MAEHVEPDQELDGAEGKNAGQQPDESREKKRRWRSRSRVGAVTAVGTFLTAIATLIGPVWAAMVENINNGQSAVSPPITSERPIPSSPTQTATTTSEPPTSESSPTTEPSGSVSESVPETEQSGYYYAYSYPYHAESNIQIDIDNDDVYELIWYDSDNKLRLYNGAVLLGENWLDEYPDAGVCVNETYETEIGHLDPEEGAWTCARLSADEGYVALWLGPLSDGSLDIEVYRIYKD